MARSLKQLTTRHALTLRFAVVPALALLSLTGVLYLGTTWLVARELNEQANLQVQARSKMLAGRLQNALMSTVRGVEHLAHYESLNQAEGRPASRQEMQWLLAEMPAYVWIGFVSPQGRVEVATQRWLEGSSVADQPVYLRGREKLVLEDFHPAVRLTPYLTQAGVPTSSLADIGMPVRDSSGRLLGIVVAHVGERWFSELAERTVTEQEAGRLGMRWYVITGSGLALGRDPLPFAPPLAGTGAQSMRGQDGRSYLVSTVSMGSPEDLVHDLGWRVVVAVDTESALAPLREFDRSLAVFAFTGCLLLSVGGFVVARRATRPIDRFFETVRSRFEAAGGLRVMPYHDYLEVMAEELATELPQERRGGGDLLHRLAQDARQLKRVIDHLPMGVSISTAELQVEYLNPAYTQMLGWTTEAVRGLRVVDYLFDGKLRADFDAQLSALAHAPTELMARFEALCADGTRLPVQWHMVPLYDPKGAVVGALTVVQDISGETQANRHAEALSDRLDLFSTAALDYVLALLDENGAVLTWSKGAEAVLGWSEAEAMAHGFDGLFTPTDSAKGVPRQLLASARDHGVCEVDAQFRRKSGTDLRGEGMLYALPVSRDAAAFALLLRDSTAAHEAADKLRRSEQELAGLTQRLLEQEKQTTRRLAQALHDELGQTLGAMRLLFDAGRNKVSPETPLPPWVARLGGLIEDSNQQVRQVLTELRPPLLDEQGLIAALDNELLQRKSLHDQVQLVLQSTGVCPDQRWSQDVEYAAFMVAREAVTNALKHANPRRVVVELAGDDLSFSLTVRDDGATTQTAPQAKPGHLGLVGMRERALAIGAHLDIRSTVGIGTTVTLEWEMNDDAAVPRG